MKTVKVRSYIRKRKTITAKDVIDYFENLSWEKQRKLLDELERIHNPML